jgi:hypothetical protein
MNGTQTKIVYMDDYWYVRAENDEWHLTVTHEAVEASLGIERRGRE